MLTAEMNERLTRVGPGTPAGTLLRRYWHPVATSTELDAERVLPVKLLGEELALFKNDDGALGLVSRRCPHRSASLAYGMPEEDGIRCPYHGWKFSFDGRCVEQPAEPEDSTFKYRVRIPAYQAQELGGLVWAYLGPDPAPLLPRWDVLVREDLDREIGVSHIPCNWLQMMENSMDPVHFEYLHGMFGNWVERKQGRPPLMSIHHHEQIAFDVWEFGIQKRRLLEGETEDCDDWQLGHPVLFPNILAQGDSSRPTFQIRVPVDDTHTLHYWYWTRPRKEDAPKQETIPAFNNPCFHDDGRLVVETINGQDMMAWISQGPISDRTIERLGTTDKGVILFRQVVADEIDKALRGEDTLGQLHDPPRNEPMIKIPRENQELAPFRIEGRVPLDPRSLPAAKRPLERIPG